MLIKFNPQKIFFWFICAIVLCSIGVTAETSSNAPIVVSLTTESNLVPVYLTKIYANDTALSPDYIKKLEGILRFDFEHDGLSSLVSCTQAQEDLAKTQDVNAVPDFSSWKTFKAFYLIKVKVQNKQLSARLYAANSEKIKTVDNITLEGDLNKDRRKIHLLSDRLHQALYDTNGVASTKILYTVKDRDVQSTWQSSLWECDYDGANAKKLSLSNAGYVITPTYMPPKPGFNSGTFFYVSYQTGQPKIYFQSLAENALPKRLNMIRGNQLMPAISRQRDKIAFICDITGNPDLFIQPFNPDGGPVGKPYQIFSNHLASQGTPTFSPDGAQIAFVSNKDGSPRVYLMDVPAPGQSLKNVKAKLITKCNKESSAPAWSPDGGKLAYCSMVKGVRQVWIYDFTTRTEKQLTQGPNNKENPTWAPDSLHLCFNTSHAGSCELYLVNLNQPDAIKITQGSGEKRFPAWEPRN